MSIDIGVIRGKLAAYCTTLGRAVRSKVVLSAAAGFAVHAAVRKNLIPDGFFSQAVEGASYVLCAIFRVTATDDLRSGGDLK